MKKYERPEFVIASFEASDVTSNLPISSVQPANMIKSFDLERNDF